MWKCGANYGIIGMLAPKKGKNEESREEIDSMATSKNTSALDRHFGYTAKGSSFKTECLAGLTTFFAMAYILMVNAHMFANPFGDGTNVLGVTYGAIYIATAISAVIGTVAIGLLANLPLAQASGMGIMVSPVQLAACMLVILPLLMMYFVFHRKFIRSIDLTGLAN